MELHILDQIIEDCPINNSIGFGIHHNVYVNSVNTGIRTRGDGSKIKMHLFISLRKTKDGRAVAEDEISWPDINLSDKVTPEVALSIFNREMSQLSSILMAFGITPEFNYEYIKSAEDFSNTFKTQVGINQLIQDTTTQMATQLNTVVKNKEKHVHLYLEKTAGDGFTRLPNKGKFIQAGSQECSLKISASAFNILSKKRVKADSTSKKPVVGGTGGILSGNKTAGKKVGLKASNILRY